MNRKNSFLYSTLLIFSLLIVKPISSMEKSRGKEPDFISTQDDIASLESWLRSELNKQSLNLILIKDLINLGAALRLNEEEKDRLLAIIKAKSTPKEFNPVKMCLAAPIVSLHTFSGRKNYLDKARARVNSCLGAATSSSSTSSSSTSSSSSRKRSASAASLTEQPIAPKVTPGTVKRAYEKIKAAFDKQDFALVRTLVNKVSQNSDLLKALFCYQDPNNLDRTIFHMAALSFSEDTFELLLQLLNDIGQPEILRLPDTPANLTAIDYAILGRREGIVRSIVRHQMPALFIPTHYNHIPFGLVLSLYSNNFLIQILSLVPEPRTTLLHAAILSGRVYIVQKLVSTILANNQLHGILMQEDFIRLTPLALAIHTGNSEIITILEGAQAHLAITNSTQVITQQEAPVVIPDDEQTPTPIIVIDDDEEEGEESTQAVNQTSLNRSQQQASLSIDQLNISFNPESPTSFLTLDSFW